MRPDNYLQRAGVDSTVLTIECHHVALTQRDIAEKPAAHQSQASNGTFRSARSNRTGVKLSLRCRQSLELTPQHFELAVVLCHTCR